MKSFLLSILILFRLGSIAQDMDVQHYRFNIELTDASDAINGKATIRIKFLKPTSRFVLDLASVQDDKGMQVFRVKELTETMSSRFTHRNNQVQIDLNKPAAAEEVRTFEIEYMGVPKDGLIISKNKYNERTFFSDNWPDRAHEWIPCRDIPSDKSPVEFIVTAPEHYSVVSNGLLLEEKILGNGSKRTHWKEEASIPTKVMVIGVARFAITRVDSSYHIPVTAWVFRKDSAKGVFDYSLTDDILKFFEDYIGPYPYKKLANVQSTTIFGGMENANAIFYDENTVTGDRKSEDLMAHEIIHQWFGNTATEKNFAHLWLSEGFATYLTNLYFEQKYGHDSFVKRLKDDKNKIIAFSKRKQVPVVDSVSTFMELLNANSYQKGAWVLHMLRGEVGDEQFKAIIQSYYRQYKDSNADTRDFQKIAETVAGRDLKWFFDQWLYQPGIPQLEIKMKLDGNELKIDITQEQKPLFRFPLLVTLNHEDGQRTMHTIMVEGKETEFRLKTKGPVSVKIDEDKVLYVTKELKQKNLN